MSDAERRRHLRIAHQSIDNAIGLLRTALDKLKLASDQMQLARDEDRPGEHQANP